MDADIHNEADAVLRKGRVRQQPDIGGKTSDKDVVEIAEDYDSSPRVGPGGVMGEG
jgi:hypothetical protein